MKPSFHILLLYVPWQWKVSIPSFHCFYYSCLIGSEPPKVGVFQILEGVYENELQGSFYLYPSANKSKRTIEITANKEEGPVPPHL